MWKFYQPVEIIFGKKEVYNLGIYMKQKELSNALLITDSIVVKLGIVDRLKDVTEGRILDVITDVEPNPTVQNVNSCIRKAKEINAECIIAIGGGSIIDCAKAVCVAVFSNYSGEDLMVEKSIPGSLPLIAIPTTAGTGSEVTSVSVLSWKEENRKTAIANPVMYPILAIVDPELTHTCPPKVTAISGIDVIAHALDSLGSIKCNSITESLAIKAARLAFENLDIVFRNGEDEYAREQMALASLLAGMAFSQTGTTGAHACSYVLTSKYNIPHGEACAFTLDSWYKINAQIDPKLNDFAKKIGFNDAETLAEELNRLKERIGLRTTLSDIGINELELDEIVVECLAANNMSNNLAQIGAEGIKDIFLNKK